VPKNVLSHMTAPVPENPQPPTAYQGPPVLRLIAGGAAIDPPAPEFAPWELHSELVLVCAELRARSLELLPEIELDAVRVEPPAVIVPATQANETQPLRSGRSNMTVLGVLLALAVFLGVLAARRA
jgi:hypothetical protein